MDENNQYNKQYSRYIRWSEEDNCWVCVVPELPGCQADGDTPQEVWDNAECIIQEWKETAKQLERDIPKGVTREITPHMKRTVVVKPIEVVQVIPHEDYTVEVLFCDGKRVIYDAKPLVGKGRFSALIDKEFFIYRCTVLNHTLAWDVTGDRDPHKCLDIDPVVLYNM